jgi:hypothetical protein
VLLPLVASDITESMLLPGQSGPPRRQGIAGLVLISVTAAAGLPLLVGSSRRRPVLYVCAAAVTLFAVATILYNGLLFLPSAGLLCAAALKSRRKP